MPVAQVSGYTIIRNDAMISGNANCAEVSNSARVCDHALISSNAKISDSAIVCGNVVVMQRLEGMLKTFLFTAMQ